MSSCCFNNINMAGHNKNKLYTIYYQHFKINGRTKELHTKLYTLIPYQLKTNYTQI